MPMTDKRFQAICWKPLEKTANRVVKGEWALFHTSFSTLPWTMQLFRKTGLYFLVQCLFHSINSGSGAANISFYTCVAETLALEHLLELFQDLSPGHQLSQLLVIIKNKAELPHGHGPWEGGSAKESSTSFTRMQCCIFFPWQHNLRTPGWMPTASSVKQTKGFATGSSKLWSPPSVK